MKKTEIYILPICLFLTVLFPDIRPLYGQEQHNEFEKARSMLLEMTEAIYSDDDELINGTIYAIPNPGINGDPYLNGGEWQNGELYIHGKRFTDQLIKYDLIIDDLILSTPGKGEFRQIMRINKSQVDSFRIGNSVFVNSLHYFPEEKNKLFYEQVYKGKTGILRRYRKIFINTYTNSTPLGKFSGLRSELFLLKEGKLLPINRKTAFLDCFAKEQQKEIRDYLSDHHIKYKKATPGQMREMMGHLANNRFF